MALPNPNLPVIDLVHGIDNLIPIAFTGYLNSKTKISSVFAQSIFPFYRFDIDTTALPAILVYTLDSREEDNSYWHTGTLKIDIILPVNVVKSNKLQSALNIINQFILLIKNDLLDWILANYPSLYGLQFFGFKNKQNYRNLYDNNAVRSKIELELEYKVNIEAYWAWLISNGYDFISPDVVIYQELQSILIDVESETGVPLNPP